MCWAKALLLPQAAAGAGAQVQQEPSAETNEGTGVTINCSHPNAKITDYIQWYRQLPGQAPAFLTFTVKGSKELQAPPGRLSVAADRRSSALWLARPRRGDAAVYYCALGDTGRGTFIWGKLLTLPCSSG
uniref:Ig-like domain-containing protein n=1 Tax=Strix occidentalis caurina TaxID=311401 RepID=A0A8D0ER69_STROC